MAELDLVPIIVALLGAGGLGAFAREIGDLISKVKRGVSTRETTRKNDIIAMRDAAVKAAEAAATDADTERRRRIAWQGYSGSLRYQLRENGIEPYTLPDDVEDTFNPKT